MNVNFNSGLFSGSSGGSSGLSGLYGLVGEYNNIRSGAYFKALKAYYAKDDTKASSSNKKNNTNDKLSELDKNEATKAYSEVKSEAADLKKAATALTKTGTDSLFVEKEKKVKDDKTGEETTVKEIDRDAINSAVKNFVSAYNDTISAANKSGNTDILRNVEYMTKNSKIFSRALSEVGITVNKDNTLSIDDEKLSSAKMDNLKTLFNGSNSYASFVSKKADMVSSAATKAASSTNSLYNNSGNYSKNNYYSNSMDWYL